MAKSERDTVDLPQDEWRSTTTQQLIPNESAPRKGAWEHLENAVLARVAFMVFASIVDWWQ
jgi:hypothetical protein